MTFFLHPEEALPLLAGLAFLATAVLLAALGAGRRRRGLLGAGPRFPGLARDAWLLAALAAVALALLGPRIGTRQERISASGIDLVVLLDVSSSMEARDVPPSRLDRARRNAELVLAALEPQDRAALAAFAGHGVLLTPLTSDADALLDVLPAVDGSLLRAQGSDLGDGLRAALSGFDAASLRPRVLLIFSDGEDSAQRPVDTAGAAAAGVRILTVALGKPEGAVIPEGDVTLRNAAGDVIQSRANPARLATVAEATEGSALSTDSFGALDVATAVAAIRRDAATAGHEPVLRNVPAVRVSAFAAVAFLLLVLDIALPRGLPRGFTRRRRAAAFAATLASVALASPGRARAENPPRPAGAEVAAAAVEALEAEAFFRPGDAAVWVRLGVARAEAGQPAEAERAFLAAALSAEEPALAALAFYDLGVSALVSGALEKARDAFFDALALDPSDDEARFNLEWTLRALREFVPPPSGGSSGSERGNSAGGGSGENALGGPAGTRGEPGADGAGAADPADSGEAGTFDPEGARAAVLGEEEAARWLDSVRDDPARALRDAGRREAAGRPPARGPGW